MFDCVYPCPCGWFGDPVKPCTCSNQTVTRYQKRISGPLLDRIDIHVEVPRVEYEKLSTDRLGESSEKIRARVEAARERQRERFGGNGSTGAASPKGTLTAGVGDAPEKNRGQAGWSPTLRSGDASLTLHSRDTSRTPARPSGGAPI